MKAIIYKAYGTPELLQLAEIDSPIPQANEVLIKVAATAVNRADLHLLSGMLRFRSGWFKPRFPVLGSDIAGTVVAVGKNVTQFQPGDAVLGDLSDHGLGGFAEYAVAPEAILVRKPDPVSFAEAAAVPMTAVTALQGVRDHGQLRSGQEILINGASGGVGGFAVQIANALGGVITAVVSPRHIAAARANGAAQIVDYTQTDFTKAGKQYDLIFDTVGNFTVAEYAQALKPNGRFVTVAFLPGLAMRKWFPGRKSGPTMMNMVAQPNREDLADIVRWLKEGKIRPLIDRCYPLAQAADALTYLNQGHATGKVIIAVGNAANR